MPDPPGHIGLYEVLEPIGSGGMGTVYRAHHAETGEIVALKVLRTDFADDPLYLRRFQREAEIAQSLTSPHIVQTLDAGVDEGTPYIAMELIEGKSLAAYMRRAGPLSVEEALDITLQIAQGLGAAHQQGVVHRDISPQNILMTREGIAKIADFGIARSDASTTLTATAAFIGKPAYASPEMLLHGRADIRGDIYALGVILFEMLSGRPPFIAPTPLATMDMHVREPPPALSAIGVRVHREVEDVLRRCLEKEADHRYQTPAEMIEAIAAPIAKSTPSTVLVETDETITVLGGDEQEAARRQPISTPGGFWRRRQFLAAVGTGIIGAALLASFIFFAAGGSDPNPLTNTFAGPEDCVVLRYPDGWVVQGEIANGNRDYCPGGGVASGTTCESRPGQLGLNVMLTATAPSEISDPGLSTAALIELHHVFDRCQQLEDLVDARVGSDLVATENLRGRLLDGPMTEDVSGFVARCADTQYESPIGVNTWRDHFCFLEAHGETYLLEVSGLDKEWGDITPILGSIELHPLSRGAEPLSSTEGEEPGSSPADDGGTAQANGLEIVDIEVGSGVEAKNGDTLVVHYTGTLENGAEFDSSEGGQPFQFTLGQGEVIEGWEQGVPGMRVGGLRQLTIPPELAYGEAGSGSVIPPNATLIFDVELLEIR